MHTANVAPSVAGPRQPRRYQLQRRLFGPRRAEHAFDGEAVDLGGLLGGTAHFDPHFIAQERDPAELRQANALLLAGAADARQDDAERRIKPVVRLAANTYRDITAFRRELEGVELAGAGTALRKHVADLLQ